MGIHVRNPKTGEVAVQAPLCTSFYDTYLQANGPVQLMDVPLSQYSAAKWGDECVAGSLNPPDEIRFNGKLVLFMETKPLCESSYFNTIDMVKRVQQAGGVGILYLNRDVGVPGLWHDLDTAAGEYRSWYQEKGFKHPLPVIQCSNNDFDSNMTYLIPAWLEGIHELVPNETANQSLWSISITEDPNLWVQQLQTDVNAYFVTLKVLFPTLSFGVALLAIRTILERYKLLKAWFTMQNIALAVEAISLTVIGVYLAVDRFYTTPYSVMNQWRHGMTGGLLFVSAATTLIVGLNYAAFRRWLNKMDTIHVSFAEKFKWVIVSVAVLFVGFELAGDYVRKVSWDVALSFNLFLALVLIACVCWFGWEVRGFVRVMTEANKSHGDPLVASIALHAMKWTMVLVISLVGLLSVYFLLVGTSIVFVPFYWKIFCASIWGYRIFASLCKVILLKPLPKQKVVVRTSPTPARTSANCVVPLGTSKLSNKL